VEQRNLLLAFALSLLALWAYQELVVSRYRKAPAPPAPAVETAEKPPAAAPSVPAEPTPPLGELAAPPGDLRAVTVETDVYRAALTPVGARVLSLELKRFKRDVSAESPPLDLVQLGPVLPATVALRPGMSDARIVYTPDRSELVLQGAQTGDVVFVGEEAGGLKLEKTYHFGGDGYLFEVSMRVVGEASLPSVGLVLTPVRPDHVANRGVGADMAIAVVAQSLHEKAATDLLKHETTIEDAKWAGFAAQYFLTAAMASGSTARAQMTATDGVPIVRVDQKAAEGATRFKVFAGPKSREVLAAVGDDLDRALNFGYFWFIAVPLLYALRMLHGLSGNYGVAIIVLTALVKLATTPLTQSTFRNMREMQKIQPQMSKLRERFKDDQVALQKEMMELYRRHRVNPFSGCLPMALQIPIFIGLYNALSHAIELRHAPFLLWINDLSAPDRLLVAGYGIPVLTILMGGTMFVQQWMSPQQGDPTQQRMMMFMPLMFTFMFLNFPSGLVLYWLVNNVLTIGQQYFIMRSSTA
jgi:YidC/Oxa1 family membrane protein insertase